MNEHPIIFSSEMVRAILDGRKTQTRRIIKPQPEVCPIETRPPAYPESILWHVSKDGGIYGGLLTHKEFTKYCLYGQVGDRLRLKEDYKYIIQGDLVITYYKYSYKKDRVEYTPLSYLDKKTRRKLIKGRKDVWKSKLLMFKFMARIWLEITNIRVERVQDISEEDCIAEGIELIYGKRNLSPFSGYKDYSGLVEVCGATASFHTLWDSLNAKRGYAWDKNPWVWVIEFRKAKDGKDGQGQSIRRYDALH